MSNVTNPGGSRPVESLRRIARRLRQRVRTDHVTPDDLIELCDSLEGIATRTEAELVKAAALPLSSAELATIRGQTAQRQEPLRSKGNVTRFPSPNLDKLFNPEGDFDNAS